MAELPTGTVTLLFSDVEASTRLVQQLGDRYEEALAAYRRLLRDAFAARGGREVDSPGDALFVVFPRARDAVGAAARAQRALAAHHWLGGLPLRARMGIHTGEPRLAQDGYVGLDVHRGARICSAAHGGQILVSRATHELVGDEPEPQMHLRDLGEHLLKDLAAPERLFQLEAPGLVTAFPSPRALKATNLPVKATRLVGRRGELEEARALLLSEDVRLVTLTGTGGVGKTRLALQLAAEVASEFRDGVFFAGLAPLADPALVSPAIALTLGLREHGGHSALEELQDYLRSRELLLLLDSVEHLDEVTPRVAAALLENAPKLKILATGRAPLHASGEHEFLLPPLAEREAVDLFAERAVAVRRDFALTRENELLVARICHRVDRLPLAIELAAARAKVLALEELLARLDQPMTVLTDSPHDVPERQRTLRRTLEWSYGLLAPDEQLLLALIAVFVGGATLDAIEAVCEREAVPLVAALVDNNMLQRVEGPPGTARFQMLETVREYALERLDERPESEELRRRHAEHFLELAERAEQELAGERQAESLEHLEAEHENLRAAVEWLLERGEIEHVLRLVAALTRFWRAHGHAEEARAWLSDALVRGAAEPAVRAKALWAAGRLAMAQSDFASAEQCHAEALEFYRRLGDARGESFALAELGRIALERGDLELAEDLCRESLKVARTAGDARAVSAALNDLASVLSALSDHARARVLYEESLALRRRLGDPLLIANSALNLAVAALADHDLGRAESASDECLAIARDLGDVIHTANTLCVLGEVALLRGELETARAHLQESLALYDQLNDRRNALECLNAVAGLAALTGRTEQAARLWGAVEAERGRLGVTVLHEGEIEIAFRLLPRAVAGLGEAGFEAARAQGRALMIEEAIAEVLEREPANIAPAR